MTDNLSSAFHHSGGFKFPSVSDGVSSPHHHGILHNLLEDAISTAKGIPFGMEQTFTHPIRSVKLMGKSYADTYGHGFGHFWHSFQEHPLQPLLDAISVPLLLAGGAGLGIKGASAAAEMGNAGRLGAEYTTALERASALTKAGKFAEADTVRASVMKAPRLDKAAQRFRKGTTATTRMVDTPMEGISLPRAYSSNLFRRAMTKGSDAIIEGVLGKKVGYFSTEHLGERMLAKELGKRSAATSARLFGQASIIREAGKMKLDPAEVGQRLVENFRKVHKDNAIRVDAAKAGALQSNKTFTSEFEFIAKDEGKFHIYDAETGKIENAGQPVEEWIAKDVEKATHRIKMAPVQVPGFILGGGPADAKWQDERALARVGPRVHDVAERPHDLPGYSEEQTKGFLRMMGKSVKTTHKADEALVEDGHVLVVRKGLGRQMQQDLEGSAQLANRIYRAPLSVWKFFILAASPRYFVNNVIGNAGMYAAATNPVEFTRGMLGAVRSTRGIRAEVRMQRRMGTELDTLMAKYLPDEWISQNMAFLQHGALGVDNTIAMRRAGPVERAAKGGLYPITEKIAYRGTQRASLMGALTTDSDFRNMYRGYIKQGMKRDEAFQKAARVVTDDPLKRAAFEKRVTDWAGQYYHLNSLEHSLTAFVPFYNWDRHALRFGKEQVLSRPVRSAVLSQLGAMGDKEAEKELGKVPDFLKGAIPVSGHAHGVLGFLLGQNQLGRRKVLLTSGYNPLASAAEDAHAVAALVGARNPGEALGGQVNPLIAGFISGVTGQRIFSGAKVKAKGGPLGEALNESFGQLPLLKAIEAEVSPPSTKTKRGEPTLYSKDARQQISSLLGLGERDFSPASAEKLYRTEHHIKKGRRHARKFAQGLKAGF